MVGVQKIMQPAANEAFRTQRLFGLWFGYVSNFST